MRRSCAVGVQNLNAHFLAASFLRGSLALRLGLEKCARIDPKSHRESGTFDLRGQESLLAETVPLLARLCRGRDRRPWCVPASEQKTENTHPNQLDAQAIFLICRSTSGRNPDQTRSPPGRIFRFWNKARTFVCTRQICGTISQFFPDWPVCVRPVTEPRKWFAAQS